MAKVVLGCPWGQVDGTEWKQLIVGIRNEMAELIRGIFGRV